MASSSGSHSPSDDRNGNPNASSSPAIPAVGGTALETIPPRRVITQGENPPNVRDTKLKSFTPKILRPNSHDTKNYDLLEFWPTILQIGPTIALVMLYLSTAIAIAVLVWVPGYNGQFTISSENVHMIARYFPSILGTITVLFFQQTIREFIRMTPYVNMADQGGHGSPGADPVKSVSGAFFPWQDFTTTKGFVPLVSLFCQIIASFIVSLKVALFATVQREHTWILTVRMYPAIILIGGYIIMALYTIFIALRFMGKSTGLRWDPISIADFVALFAHCNAVKYFELLELRHDRSAQDLVSPDLRFRLGYWDKTVEDPQDASKDKTDVVYGIGIGFPQEPDEIPVTIKPERHWYRLWIPERDPPNPTPMADHDDKLCEGKWPKKRCEHYPFRQNPGCARWVIILSTLVAWGALGASIFALTRPWPRHGFSLRNDWSLPSNITLQIGNKTYVPPPIDPSDPKSTLLVYALAFRSLPTYLAGVFTSTIITSIDLNMRFMQPFKNMFKTPAEADDSILLSYITLSPLQVPLTAYDKTHRKVAWYSALSTLSPLFPIFVGGLLTVTGNKDRVDFSFSLSAYIGIMVSLILYSISLPAAFPHPHRLLPRQFYSMADLMAFCHQARFLGSPHLDIADKQRTPTKEVMEARIRLSGDKFLFGKYKGRRPLPNPTGGTAVETWHMGFDVEQTREPDMGPLQTYHCVEPITPTGPHWFMREKAKVATQRAFTNLTGRGGQGGFFAEKRRKVQDDQDGIGTPELPAGAAAARNGGSATGSQRREAGVGQRTRTGGVNFAS